MLVVLQLIILFGAITAIAYFRLSALVWSGIVALVLLVLSCLGHLSWWFLLPCWIIFILAALIFNISLIRRVCLTRPLFRLVAKLLPSISQTEQEALAAGDIWWEGDLFRGKPDWQKLLHYTPARLTTEEQAFIDNELANLCRQLDDWQIVQQDKDLSAQTWQYLKVNGFFGLAIHKEYGGKGFSALAQSTIVATIASRSVSAAVTTMVPNSLGPGELVYHYGTQAQKDYYLPRLASGEEIPCFALTGVKAGSDAGSITDTGVICKGMYQGKEVLGMRLNWDKRYITLAPVATVIGLAFKLFDPDKLLGESEELGITLCLVPAHTEGVEQGARHFPMGLAFMNGPVRGKDVFVPLDAIIGGQAMIGQGWRMLMESLSMGRGISLPALSSAVASVCYRTTGAYARIRQQFKVALSDFEGIEAALARIAGHAYMMEATRRLTVSAIDSGVKPAVVTAISKYHMTEMSRRVLDDAMDVHAGRAIQLGPRNYLGHAYQALPISITVEGANILTRNLIIFGQGIMRCHPYLQQEVACVRAADTTKALAEFDRLLYAHLGYVACNKARAFFYGLGGWHFIRVPVRGVTAKYYRQLTRMSSVLAFIADVSLLVLGADLKRKERLSARLGDVVSHLYLGSAVLKYYQDNGCQSEDLESVQWCLSVCLHKIQVACTAFFDNFPKPWLARLLRFTVFPLGVPFKCGPKDENCHRLIKPMLALSNLRQRLSEHCYVSEDKDDAILRLDNALATVLAASEAEQKLQRGIRQGTIKRVLDASEQIGVALAADVITYTEAESLRNAEVAILDAIAVDEFTKI